MKKEEKTKRTYERIMAAAIVEFGTKSYDNASLTTLCSENQISKGLIYHNFKNKDALYLKCVEVTFHDMTVYMKRRTCKVDSMKESIQNIFSVRQQFFEENPYYCNIFFNTVLQPPKHLLNEIHELRKEYDEFYTECFRDLMQQMNLRKGISLEAAMEYFMVFMEMYNGYFQSKSSESNDMHALIKDHEVNLSRILDIMLYGVANEE